MKAKIAVLVEPGKFELEERELQITDFHQVMLKVEVCGLCNWELNHFKGAISGYPMTLGHEYAGIVEAVGEKVTRFKPGDKITVLPDVLAGFAEYAVIDESCCFKLADDADVRYSFVEPLKCVVTVLRAAAPEVGDYGVIVGCGPMGLWCVQALAGKTLAGLIAIDVDDNKLSIAKKYGVTHVIKSRTKDAVEEIEKITNGHMADFCIEGTGIPTILDQCADYLRVGRGRLCLMSYHETLAEKFNFRKFSDKGIIMLNPHPNYSADALEDCRRAVLLINNKIFTESDLISHTFRLDEIQKAFETLEHKPAGYIKGVVYPTS